MSTSTHQLPRLPDPDTTVIPGVVWGRPECVPSAAFWASMVALANEEQDGYIVRDIPLEETVGFCLLGGYGVTAELNHAAHQHLLASGAYRWAQTAADAPRRIEALLREPLEVGNKRVHYRFPRQRAIRLAAAIRSLSLEAPPSNDEHAFRAHLMRIDGIGPKTASWITRNWLGSTAVAILDIHVVRAGRIIGLFSSDNRLPRDYFVMEHRFLSFADAIGASPALLDAVIWRTMREISVGRR
jgi:N-glycosylase/DNA lyase